MRLTRRFLVAFMIAGMVVLGIYATALVSREVSFFDADMRRDATFAGNTLARAVEKTWQREGESAALSLIRQTDLSIRHIQIRWVWLDDAEVFQSLPAEMQRAARRGEIVSERIEPNGDGVGALYTYVPVSVNSSRAGALELAEGLEQEQEYLRATIRDSILEAAALLLASGAIVTLLGYLFIGRPMHLLIAKARRVGTGDLSGPLELPQQDELGELAVEINTMCDRLGEARHKVSAETKARLAAVEQLRHADRLTTVGRLASGIAHELGTPLNVISGRAQLIAGKDATSDAARTDAKIIEDQARKMTGIIRQLLDFARRGTTRKAELDLRDIAVRSVRMLDSFATKAGVKLGVSSKPAQVSVFAEPEQLEQALANLVVNAIQATNKGGSVLVEVGQEQVTPPVEHGGDAASYAFLRVSDTGSGMGEETAARVFEPFFTTKDVGVGTGLGLSVSYGIARDHGGWIDVESSLGRGSRFSIRLPVAARSAATTPSATPWSWGERARSH
jgi:two-component system, NtrC family, sensor kinase